MGGEANLLQRVEESVDEFDRLLSNGAQLQKELEGYYLRQEAQIRKRVGFIDDIQSLLAEERSVLDRQHEECRSQIAIARRHLSSINAQAIVGKETINSMEAAVAAEEADIDAQLEEISSMIVREDDMLNQFTDKREALLREEQLLKEQERHQQSEEEELNRALEEMEVLAKEIEKRKTSLKQKNETIADWNRSLEVRERELVLCQDQLRDDLKLLELDESRHGILKVTGSAAVIPVVSLHAVMDDNDMSIERESDREEIDLDDEDHM